MIQPLAEFLKDANVDLVVFTEALLQYILEAEATDNLIMEPDLLLIVEDCKRFYFILTGIWWSQAH